MKNLSKSFRLCFTVLSVFLLKLSVSANESELHRYYYQDKDRTLFRVVALWSDEIKEKDLKVEVLSSNGVQWIWGPLFENFIDLQAGETLGEITNVQSINGHYLISYFNWIKGSAHENYMEGLSKEALEWMSQENAKKGYLMLLSPDGTILDSIETVASIFCHEHVLAMARDKDSPFISVTEKGQIFSRIWSPTSQVVEGYCTNASLVEVEYKIIEGKIQFFQRNGLDLTAHSLSQSPSFGSQFSRGNSTFRAPIGRGVEAEQIGTYDSHPIHYLYTSEGTFTHLTGIHDWFHDMKTSSAVAYSNQAQVVVYLKSVGDPWSYQFEVRAAVGVKSEPYNDFITWKPIITVVDHFKVPALQKTRPALFGLNNGDILFDNGAGGSPQIPRIITPDELEP